MGINLKGISSILTWYIVIGEIYAMTNRHDRFLKAGTIYRKGIIEKKWLRIGNV